MTLRAPESPTLADGVLVDSFAGMPFYLANFSVALLLLTIALAAYALFAGRADLVRARQGNAAAAISVAGVLLGFALPLASVIASVGSLVDLLVWALVALGVQLVAVLVLRRVLRGSSSKEDAAREFGGILHGALSLAVGLINAAALLL